MVDLAPTGDARTFRLGFAGYTFNTAWYLAQISTETEVAFLTAVGDDDLSSEMLEFMRSGTPVTRIARDAGCNDALIRTRGQLAFLAPKIQIAIRDGTLPPELTLKRILRQPIPLDWDKQARLFGV